MMTLGHGKAVIPEDDSFPSLTEASTTQTQEMCQALVNWGPRAEIELLRFALYQ